MDKGKGQVFDKNDTHGTQSCRRILDAALKEFSHHGMEGARVDRIAREARVNKAMIYYYFSSKEKLYTEVLKAGIEVTIASLKTRVAETDKLEDVLLTIQEGWGRAFLHYQDVSKLLLRELADPDSKVIPTLAEIISHSEMPLMIRRRFENGVENGTLRSVDLRQAWVSFVTMNIGYCILSPLLDRVLGITDHEQFVKERRPAVLDLFLNGVKTR